MVYINLDLMHAQLSEEVQAPGDALANQNKMGLYYIPLKEGTLFQEISVFPRQMSGFVLVT